LAESEMTEQNRMVVDRLVRPPAPGSPMGAVSLTPRDVFLILRRHIWLIVVMAMAGFAAGGAGWFLLLRYNPKYTAQTYLEVLSPVEKDPMLIGGPLVQKEIQYGYRSTIAGLISRQTTFQSLLDRDRIQKTKWFTQFAKYDENGNIVNKDRCIRKAFKDLIDNFRAHPERDREYVALSMTCGDKAESALIVNEMMSLFLASQGRSEQSEIEQDLTNLEARRIKVQNELLQAEEALKDVRETTGLTDLDTATEGRYFQHTITQKLNNLEIQHDDLMLQISQVQAAIGELEELATGPVTVQIEERVEDDPVVILLNQQLALRQAALAGELSRFGEDHRVVRQTKQLIEQTKQEIELRKAFVAEQIRQAQVRNAQDQLVVLGERLAKLQRMREEAQAKQKELDAARAQYTQRLKIRDERQEMLDSIKEQIEKLRMMHDAPETPKVRSLGPAPEPLEVSSPRWEFYFPGGTTLGLMFGVGFAFLIEVLNDRVRTPRDVSKFLHIPLLGVIPDSSEDGQVDEVDLYHVVRQAPYSIISESYRHLRTNLRLSGAADANRVLVVTSGMPGEGKTSVAANLAATLLAQNKKVLLIDANFRKPSLQMIFSRPRPADLQAARSEFGLSSLLTGLCKYEQAKRSNVLDGLDILESGPLPPNPAELIGSVQMEQLIAEQRKNYDYIIIDTAPVLLVSDAKVPARLADGTILVFNAEMARRGAAQRTIREMKEVNATVVGCVLFAAKALKGGYFREQFKSYQRYQELQLAHS